MSKIKLSGIIVRPIKISGHKSLQDFYKYIRINPEEAGLKIKEIWQKRGETLLSNASLCGNS